MRIKSQTFLCMSAVFGLPFLIAGCADAIVEETTSTAPEAATPETDVEATGVECLVVNEDGTIGHSAVAFQEAIASKDGIVLVDFWAPWCPPCRDLAPELEQLAADYPDQITIVKIDIDIAPEIAKSYEVSSIPDMRIFKAGQQIDAIMGYNPAANIASKLGL